MKFTRKTGWIWLVLLAVLVLVGCGGAAAAPTIARATPAEVYPRLPGDLDNGLILLDVRTSEEWRDDGHIQGATLLPLQELEARAAAELPKDAEIIVYCRSGNRSEQAATYLASQGYTNIVDMGGINGWIAAGYPVVTGP